jgi:hypothetical protein
MDGGDIGCAVLMGLGLLLIISWGFSYYWGWASAVLIITPYPNINGVIVTIGIIAGISCVVAFIRSDLGAKTGRAINTLTDFLFIAMLIILCFLTVVSLVVWLFRR